MLFCVVIIIFSSSFHFFKSYINSKGNLTDIHGLPTELENRKYQALDKEDSRYVNLTCLETMWNLEEMRTVPRLTEEVRYKKHLKRRYSLQRSIIIYNQR